MKKCYKIFELVDGEPVLGSESKKNSFDSFEKAEELLLSGDLSSLYSGDIYAGTEFTILPVYEKQK